MSKKKAVVFRHMHQESFGSLEEVLWGRDFEFEYFNTARGNFDDIDPLEPDFLAIMGGPCGVYQTEDFPFLQKVIDAAKTRVEKDLPTFGICLGSQIIAKALGANVYKGANGKERGWHPLTILDAAKGTALEHLAPEKTNMFHWHGDTFDLPEGATLLASSAQYKHQAFSWGKNVLALQCHPEVTEGLLQEWFVGLVDEVTGPNAEVPLGPLREETSKNSETLKKQARAFFNDWLESIGL